MAGTDSAVRYRMDKKSFALVASDPVFGCGFAAAVTAPGPVTLRGDRPAPMTSSPAPSTRVLSGNSALAR